MILFTGKQLTIFMDLGTILQNFLLGKKEKILQKQLQNVFFFFFPILKEK